MDQASSTLSLRRIDVRWILAFVADVAALVVNGAVVNDLPFYALFLPPTLSAALIAGAIHGWRWCGWIFIGVEAIGVVTWVVLFGLPEFAIALLYLVACLLALSAMHDQKIQKTASS